MTTPSHADDALQFVRSLLRQHEGSLAFGDRRAKVRFVHSGGGEGDPVGSNRIIVLPIEPGVLRIDSAVVFCPDEPESHVQILISPAEIERPESSPLVDKWCAYHGHIAARKWGVCRVEGLRTFSTVADADDLMLPGLPASAEPRLVKRANSDQPRLSTACLRCATAEVADPVCVGVDALGLDVRARFGIVRLEFDRLVSSEADAAGAIDRLLSEGPDA